MAKNTIPPISFSLSYPTACLLLDVLLQQRVRARLYAEDGYNVLYSEIQKLDSFINALEEYAARAK